MSAVNFALNDITELEQGGQGDLDNFPAAVIRLRNYFEVKASDDSCQQALLDLEKVESGESDPEVFNRLRAYIAETK